MEYQVYSQLTTPPPQYKISVFSCSGTPALTYYTVNIIHKQTKRTVFTQYLTYLLCNITESSATRHLGGRGASSIFEGPSIRFLSCNFSKFFFFKKLFSNSALMCNTHSVVDPSEGLNPQHHIYIYIKLTFRQSYHSIFYINYTRYNDNNKMCQQVYT